MPSEKIINNIILLTFDIFFATIAKSLSDHYRKGIRMSRGSTFILRLVILLIALGGLALAAYVLPTGILTDRTGYYRPILIGMYVPAIPFFIALFQSLRLLNLIDKNQPFSSTAAQCLKVIKYCAAVISALYAVGMPYIYYAADRDDAPGVVAIGLIIVFASFVVATAAGVFQKLLESAINLKSENDLTV